MWKRGGRSSALDRAQALLSAKRTSGGGAESVPEPAATTRGHAGAVVGSVKTRSAPPNTHTLISDLSDLSSVSSAPEHGADAAGSAAAGKTRGDSTEDLRPQSSLGGGRSRFLKKAPPPAINSSYSPVSKSQMQQEPEPRYVSSSQRGSQNAALSRLAQIESRIRSRKQAGQGLKPAENQTSDMGIPPPPAAQSLEASVQLSAAQSSSDQSLKGKLFLKNNTTTAVNNSKAAAAAAARSHQGPDVGVRSRSRAADAVVPSGGLETKSVRVVSGVSLESDEEDMRKLLGESLDSIDNSFLIPGRPADKMLSKSHWKVHATPSHAAVPPSSSSNTAPPRSPASPSHRSSPFRFTGQAQAHFSPSVLSPSPSPPRVSPSPLGRLHSPHRAQSPPRSLSSMSGRSEVLSLEELFPVGPGSEDLHSERSTVSSEDGQQDFKINVMTLDDLGFTEETPVKERGVSAPVPGPPNRHQLPRLKEEEEEQQLKEEDLLDYQSDFESESRTEPNYSTSQVSEDLQGHGDGEEEVSEVREQASDLDVSCGRTEDDYSSAFSDTGRSYTSQTSDHSQTLSRNRGSRSYRSSRSSVSHGSRTSSHQSRRRASTRKVLKEAAVQTQSNPLVHTWPGMAPVGPAVGMTYMDPSPVLTHTLSAEMVEALSTFNPAVFALNELLKQQLAMTRRFIESSRHLHSSLVKSLEPPNYRYTTLEDTKEYIRKHRAPKLTMEEALEEALQEIRLPTQTTDCPPLLNQPRAY